MPPPASVRSLSNGGVLQGDSLNSNFRMSAPLTIAGNTIELAHDSTIQMQNNAGDFRLTGALNLGSGSTGAAAAVDCWVWIRAAARPTMPVKL